MKKDNGAGNYNNYMITIVSDIFIINQFLSIIN